MAHAHPGVSKNGWQARTPDLCHRGSFFGLCHAPRLVDTLDGSQAFENVSGVSDHRGQLASQPQSRVHRLWNEEHMQVLRKQHTVDDGFTAAARIAVSVVEPNGPTMYSP